MGRPFAGDTLVIASHNKGKVREIIELLAPFNLHVFSANDIEIEEPEETETTFAGNAALKARWVADRCGHMALADDSGLSVAALDGAPGVYSARWAGPQKDFPAAMARVEAELRARNASDLSAKFVSVLALALLGSLRDFTTTSSFAPASGCTTIAASSSAISRPATRSEPLPAVRSA